MTGTTHEPWLRKVQVATLFDLTETGRLLRVNSPDRSPAPRLWLGGSAAGNVLRLGAEVGERTAHEIEALAAGEPPMAAETGVPVHHDAYVELLSAEAPIQEVSRDLTYVFGELVEYGHPAPAIRSGTPEGDAFVALTEADGMPEGLAQMGFADTGDLWPPWCVALDGGAAASIAITARLSAAGAEVGVATAPAIRGRGLATAVVAAWATHSGLSDRARFYSCAVSNASSQRVAQRLGLGFVGPGLAIR